MWDLIIKSFYLVLPAYLANMSPVIFAKLKLFKFLARPIDGGKKMSGADIFGSSKTWRGLLAGVILGVLVASLQAGLYNYDFFYNLSLFNYQVNFLIFGFLAGLGAILGDLIKSFFKRRIGIKSGGSWPIFDQLDFIVGFFIFTYLIYQPPIQIVATVLMMTLILHPVTNIIGYLTGFKKVWW